MLYSMHNNKAGYVKVKDLNNIYKPETVRRNGVLCPKGSETMPYAYASIGKSVRVSSPAVRIREIRERLLLTQKAFAQMCSEAAEKFGGYVTQADISQYESGKYCPKMDKFVTIAIGIAKTTGMSSMKAQRYLAGYAVTEAEQ